MTRQKCTDLLPRLLSEREQKTFWDAKQRSSKDREALMSFCCLAALRSEGLVKPLSQ